MENTQKKLNSAYDSLKAPLKLVNTMQTPRLVKIVVSVGTGSFKDKKKNEIVSDRLAKITGQKAAQRGAKKSIASFKVRQGEVIGFQVTLRGKRMRGFFDKLINTALPRTKDFKGLSSNSIDEMGNLTIGVKEHTIFPETADEELKDIFGLSTTIVSTAKNKEDALKFFSFLGIPFKK